MDVIFVSQSDWSNVGATCAAACRSVGLKARGVERVRHKYNYPIKNDIWTGMNRLQNMVGEAKAVVFMHSVFMDKLKLNMEKQKIAVFHGGTRYRQSGKAYAKRLFLKTHKTFIQGADLMGFGSRNETWLIPPVDDVFLTPQMRPLKALSTGYIIGHYPRASGDGLVRKGAKKVCKVMEQFKDECRFWYSPIIKEWLQHIDRVSKCDIYIERLGDVCLEWGLSAMEAAAMGKVVVTTFKGKDAYEKVFGSCPFVVANSEEELAWQIHLLLGMRPEEIREIQTETREWVSRMHGLEATGRYLAIELGLL